MLPQSARCSRARRASRASRKGMGSRAGNMRDRQRQRPPWASADALIPRGGGLPFPVPAPPPAAESSQNLDDRDKDGPACPPFATDRSRGARPAADAYESVIHGLVNPHDPTPDGYAYYLPSDTPDGKTSFDDCKRTDFSIGVPGLSKGDMVDAKNEAYSELSTRGWFTGFEKMRRQLTAQDGAVQSEGKGRRVFVCFAGEVAADYARKYYRNTYKNIAFLACPFREGS